MSRIDARLHEMQFLARLDRDGPVEVNDPYDGSPERQMIISLVSDGYVNGVDSKAYNTAAPGMTMTAVNDERATDIWRLLHCQNNLSKVQIRISHKGRVRLSELQQQLKTGRDRDPTGLCLARRHLMTDLAIAVLSANADAVLTVVFLDMNGLKAINDNHGHHAGDEAIRAYLEAVVATFGEHGEAYRGEGGDEVVVLLPGVAEERAGVLLEMFTRQLGKDVLVIGNTTVRLTASCGSTSTANPSEDAAMLLKRADEVQYRAKAEARKHATRRSTIAVGDSAVITCVLEP